MAKKRANGEGSLRQLESGRWTCQVMVGYKPDGKRDIHTLTAKTRREVIQKRDELNRKKADGAIATENLCFEEWSDTWFESHKDNIMPTTQENYQYTLRILKAAFPHKNKRTGCVGCPFGKDFEAELENAKQFEPRLYEAVNNIFKDSYEYTRAYLKFREEKKKE